LCSASVRLGGPIGLLGLFLSGGGLHEG
jgi:hypothetical protein